MKVILLGEIKGKGGEGDIVDVAQGYAENYLFPKKLAVAATKGELKQLEQRRNNIAKREEKRLADATRSRRTSTASRLLLTSRSATRASSSVRLPPPWLPTPSRTSSASRLTASALSSASYQGCRRPHRGHLALPRDSRRGRRARWRDRRGARRGVRDCETEAEAEAEVLRRLPRKLLSSRRYSNNAHHARYRGISVARFALCREAVSRAHRRRASRRLRLHRFERPRSCRSRGARMDGAAP